MGKQLSINILILNENNFQEKQTKIQSTFQRLTLYVFFLLITKFLENTSNNLNL